MQRVLAHYSHSRKQMLWSAMEKKANSINSSLTYYKMVAQNAMVSNAEEGRASIHHSHTRKWWFQMWSEMQENVRH